LGRCRPPPESKQIIASDSGGSSSRAAAKANSVKIKVQWNADVLFAPGLQGALRNLPWSRPRLFKNAKEGISALTGHRHGLKKWPTQNLSSRQPAWATTQAGELSHSHLILFGRRSVSRVHF